MNVVFISPHFPLYFHNFCSRLKERGVNVLGIGDEDYNLISNEAKNAVTEYYKVSNLENFEEVENACKFYENKYGKIDWIESQNEYWLEMEATLRSKFNVNTGTKIENMSPMKYKSKMKEYYKKVGIPTARYHIAQNFDESRKFIDEVGYPVVVKPDNGVGASHTYKIENDEQLQNFFDQKEVGVRYIMEEFINGEVNSYDAIINSKGEIMFETGNVTPMSIMDIVNNNDNSIFYIVKNLPEDTRKAGRVTVESFGVKSRFVHFEFFRLLSDKEGLGKKGDIVALEVNMRPSGGVTPDMINFANSTDVYKIWADMIAFDRTEKSVGNHSYCAFAGLRDGKNFVMSHDDIMAKYGENMKMCERVPDALSGAMGNQLYLATFDTKEEMDKFYEDVLRCKE